MGTFAPAPGGDRQVGRPDQARRRVTLRLQPRIADRLEACAARSGVAVNTVIQELLDDALDEDPPAVAAVLARRRAGGDLIALATLWAAEEIRLSLEQLCARFGVVDRDDDVRALIEAEERVERLRGRLECG